MATQADIQRLRRLVGESTEAEPWTDLVLSAIIDDTADLNTAALEVWEAKAAEAASMVDVTESGSSRRMSQLHQQALTMVAHFRTLISTSPQPQDLAGYAYTTPIERV